MMILILIGFLTLGVSVSIAALSALYFLLKRHAKWGTDFDPDEITQSKRSISIRTSDHIFTYNELEEATKGFGDDQKLADMGDGGALYAGILENKLVVAVHKMQLKSETELIQVVTYVKILSKVSHKSMARILGWYVDSSYTPLAVAMVVYEYPGNGTLEQHLSPQAVGVEWHNRLNIAAQTASLLAFLQSEIFPPVSHHSLQSGCIMLDEDFSVKLGGFELLEGQLHGRNDVYRTGVVLLEIIAGGGGISSSTAALQKITMGKLEEVVDPFLYYHEQPGFVKEQIEMVADIATRCLLFGGDGKLGMNDVARELVHLGKGNINGSKRGGAGLEETFSNSSLLQMVSMSPDSTFTYHQN